MEGAAGDLPTQARICGRLANGPARSDRQSGKTVSAARQRQRSILEFYFSHSSEANAMAERHGGAARATNASCITPMCWWTACNRRARRKSAPGAGFGGMEIKIESEAFRSRQPFSFLEAWHTFPTPNRKEWRCAWIRAPTWCSTFICNLPEKQEWIQPSLGLYFTDQPATRFPMLLQLENDQKLDIPPGEKNFRGHR